MKDPQLKEWLEHRFLEVSKSLTAQNEEDQIDAILYAMEALNRAYMAIEARLSIWNKPYPDKYVPPWMCGVAKKPEGV